MFETLGNLGDFIGGIAVLVTLIYLAFQIRQNTKSTHSASYQAIVASLSQGSREVAYDEERTKIFISGLKDIESLSETDRARFYLLMTSLWRNYENIHFQFKTGAIPNEVWNGWARRITSSARMPGAAAWWEDEQTNYSESFRLFINDDLVDLENIKLPFGIRNAKSN